MTTKQFATNLNCGKCVAAIAPQMDSHPEIDDWKVDTNVAEKTLSVAGAASEHEIRSIVSSAGFKILDDSVDVASVGPQASKTWLATYRPLLLIVGYLLGVVLLCEYIFAPFAFMRAMRHFMAGFFLAFSFFKMLDINGFATSFASYDPIASRSRTYGYLYPFIELAIGVCYLLNVQPIATNLVTAVVMLIGIVGVTQVLRQNRTIQCACLGTVFNLPMSVVTFVENGLMILMACTMLALYLVG